MQGQLQPRVYTCGPSRGAVGCSRYCRREGGGLGVRHRCRRPRVQLASLPARSPGCPEEWPPAVAAAGAAAVRGRGPWPPCRTARSADESRCPGRELPQAVSVTAALPPVALGSQATWSGSRRTTCSGPTPAGPTWCGSGRPRRSASPSASSTCPRGRRASEPTSPAGQRRVGSAQTWTRLR